MNFETIAKDYRMHGISKVTVEEFSDKDRNYEGSCPYCTSIVYKCYEDLFFTKR